MQTLRNVLAWLFAFTALVCLYIVFLFLLGPGQPHTYLSRANLVVAVVFTVLAITFGMAWWTGFMEKRSARGWGIAASLVNILLSLFPAIVAWRYSSKAAMAVRTLWHSFSITFVVGIAGLIAFWRPYQLRSTAEKQERRSIPGDGTSNLLNRAIGLILFGICFGVYHWWLRWLRAKGIPEAGGMWQSTGMVLIIVLAITSLHEFGHTAVGLALGMRLRALIIGPFQWRIRDGRWHFQFRLADIVTISGGTGVVPTSTNFPRSSYLSVLAAGPLANLLTGLVALWVAFSARGGSPVQAHGSVALFGAWSMAIGAANLVPFRIKNSYSDGANIFQLLAGGAWGDFHRAIEVVTSSLVTPLRPRDYEIEVILRAAHTITHGTHGLLLRLYAYSYYLDQGRIPEASQALSEAELVYQQSASDIPAELLSVFVFGGAYVRRDGAAAREWWMRMEARKPIRFNVDYWRAKSALHWVEGNVKEASEAWVKANALAQQLPKAGAYDFDRYCCSLLRNALDESSSPKTTSVSGA